MLRPIHGGIFILLALSAGLVTAAAGGEIPVFAGGGSWAILHAPLKPAGSFPLHIAAGSAIACEGDSNTQGTGDALIGRTGAVSYCTVFAAALGHGLRARNRGVGGHRAADGLAHWRGADPVGLAIIQYGTNDAAPRGWLGLRRRTAPADYRQALAAIVDRHHRQGAQVLVLAPPPSATRAMERRIAPYRQIARAVALDSGAAFLDPVAAFASQPPQLRRDGLHLRKGTQRAIGAWLARHVVQGQEANPGAGEP